MVYIELFIMALRLSLCAAHDHFQSFTDYKCPKKIGMFADPGDCSNYIVCHKGAPMMFTCPEGGLFNPKKFVCVSNDPPYGCFVSNATTETKTFKCPSLLPGPQTYTCPQGWHYNPIEEECEADFVPEGCRVRHGEMGKHRTHSCKTTNGFFADRKNCAAYYICKDGLATLYACPIGEFYDPLKEACVKGFKPTGCKMKDQTMAGHNEKRFIECPPDKERVLIAHPNICNAFYTCVNGDVDIDTCTFCPEGSHFDEGLLACIPIIGDDFATLCPSRERMIPPAEFEQRKKDCETCWPYATKECHYNKN